MSFWGGFCVDFWQLLPLEVCWWCLALAVCRCSCPPSFSLPLRSFVKKWTYRLVAVVSLEPPRVNQILFKAVCEGLCNSLCNVWIDVDLRTASTCKRFGQSPFPTAFRSATCIWTLGVPSCSLLLSAWKAYSVLTSQAWGKIILPLSDLVSTHCLKIYVFCICSFFPWTVPQ